jgi:hypothetical protein
MWTVLVVLYGPFLLLFEIIPSVDSTGGIVWAVLLLFEIIPSVDSTGGTVWAVFIVFLDNTLCGQYWWYCMGLFIGV